MSHKLYRQFFGPNITQSEIEEFDDSIYDLFSILTEVESDLNKENENNKS